MMEQLQELLDILAKTPEMAIWGLVIYLLFLLLKLASWVGAITFTTKLFINRYFAYHTIKQEIELKKANVGKLDKLLDKELIGDPQMLLPLLNEVGEGTYVHEHHIREAVKILRKHKEQQ